MEIYEKINERIDFLRNYISEENENQLKERIINTNETILRALFNKKIKCERCDNIAVEYTFDLFLCKEHNEELSISFDLRYEKEEIFCNNCGYLMEFLECDTEPGNNQDCYICNNCDNTYEP